MAMEPHILKSAEKLMASPGILGVVVGRKETLYFYKTDPRFSSEQIQDFTQKVHHFFSGYWNVQRNISEAFFQFDHVCLSLIMLHDLQNPVYVATLAQNLEALTQANQETRQWTLTDLVKTPKRSSRITTKLRPTAHLEWGRFLARLRKALDQSLGEESGSVVLTRSLDSFKISSNEPLPSEQWLAFVAEVGNQIPNAEARERFYKLYSQD
jgi:hypothetical protein